MEQRRAELDLKRQKLQELRKQRAERRKTMTQSVGDEATAQELGIAGNSSFSRNRQNIDDLVSSLVGDRNTNSNSSLTIGVGTDDLSFSSNQGSLSNTGGNTTPLNTLSPTMDQSVQFSRPPVKLEMVETVIFDQPPKEKVLYSKEVQTTTSMYDEPVINEEEVQRRLKEEREKEEQLKQAQLEEEARALELEEEQINKELTEEERLAIVSQEEFLQFINNSSKVVERALSQPYNYLVDYTQTENLNKDEAEESIKLVQTYFDDRLTKNRSVMDIDWSIKYPELFLGAYNKNLSAAHDPDGLVCVWNMHLTDRAEFVFHAPSDVLTAKFSPFHPNYIVGGTYTGQILLWDTRSKRLPVLKSPLNSTGHTHPVYNLTMIGTHNAHNCITASSDGMICAWQLDLLAQPQEVLELLHPSPLRADDLGITALDFPTNETATFWVGTEEGAVYQINRYDRAGTKVGVHPNDLYMGHSGPITSLHFHPQVGALDFSDLFLTTSFDWTIKLWQAKSLTRPSPTPTQIAPLVSFENGSDYILDAQWSPSHPGAFGSVDAGGNFNVWNLNQDIEIPISTLNLTSRGLNKLKWDKEGSKAAIGASDGKIYVCEVPSLSNPHPEDGAIFQKTVSSLTRNALNKDN